MIKFNYNDGGRLESGFKGSAGDCGVRALAITLNKPYKEIMEIWKSKQIYRDKYDDEWLIGMKLNAGKLGAKYIKKFINDEKNT